MSLLEWELVTIARLTARYHPDYAEDIRDSSPASILVNSVMAEVAAEKGPVLKQEDLDLALRIRLEEYLWESPKRNQAQG